ncbi:MAG TPA: vitamin B12 dependent-methionine synthase activation domain-containing protein, partial [Gemmatimonadales bacterium]|nr:vitamin B12 dependent-methionine synthase activation domain-containing protein [Gemmatimonadales bacterium]
GGAIRARGVIGFWPADAGGDDITLYHDEGRTRPLTTLHMLRQQARRSEIGDRKSENAASDLRSPVSGLRPSLALSDFVAPREANVPDYLGAFAVTTGHGLEPLVQGAKARHDDYRAIMLAAMTDRLAEAFAERLHEQVRKEYWGYAADESLDNADLIREKYQGIRPAPGYPACPDHTEKFTLMKLLDAEQNAGIVLTESCAMIPGAAVSGWYF